MKTAILFIFLISSFGISAQDISESEFKNSNWFTEINGGNIFKTDTIIISKLTNIEPKKYSHMRMFVEMDYLEADLFSALEFRKNDIYIQEIDKDACGFSYSETLKWEFDNETQILRFYKNDNLIAEYEIISQKTNFTEWSNKEEKPIEISANVLTLELIKLRK
ncbi:hypothetical protein [Winogradskyella sp. 4-2091]|uniref:hypothetical protein n=1 Tax=Winogradskyella sp. 4-2091 TaxID=3381659 RepID=UPI003892BCCE